MEQITAKSPKNCTDTSNSSNPLSRLGSQPQQNGHLQKVEMPSTAETRATAGRGKQHRRQQKQGCQQTAETLATARDTSNGLNNIKRRNISNIRNASNSKEADSYRKKYHYDNRIF
jgi:hypothetical protein